MYQLLFLLYTLEVKKLTCIWLSLFNNKKRDHSSINFSQFLILHISHNKLQQPIIQFPVQYLIQQ